MTELNYLDITKASDGHIRVPSIGLTSPAITESIAKTALASFADGAAGIPVKSLIADINPVQTGSGDPSPSNVRPITGWTGMNVVRTGKNLINFPDCASANVNIINNTYNPYWNELNSHYPFKENTQYTFSCQFSTTDTENSWGLRVEYTNGTVAYIWLHNQTTDTNSITTAANRTIKRIHFAYSAAFTLEFSNAQLEEGTTATTFERSGTTYPISWADEAGTVYGGTLDVTNGVLTVTDGNIASYNGETLPSTWISDRDVYAVGTTPTTGAQVVYKLATPQTYQLTPQAVLTILGQNNIWADTGDVEVAYCADTKLYIDKVLTE